MNIRLSSPRFALSAIAAGLMATAHPAGAASDLVISQVFGGGGNSGAPYRNDFVELFNRGASAMSLAGWSLQYASATGTGTFAANGAVALPAVTLQPGQYFLVQLAGGATGSALPTADASAAGPNLSGSAGKVALVNSAGGLACNGGSSPCSAAQLAQIIDLVGYGSANFAEGAAAPALTTATAAQRAGDGCTDTDANASDFSIGAPLPRNTATALHNCGGGVVNQPIAASCPTATLAQGAGGSVTLTASDPDSRVTGASLGAGMPAGFSLASVTPAAADGAALSAELAVAAGVAGGTYGIVVDFANDEAQTASCTATVTVTGLTPIPAMQGSGATSPYTGQSVTTRGVVTTLLNNGFYMQDEAGDGDPATSDGIFVFTSTAPAVTVGDRVQVAGTVAEFKPAGAPADYRPVTEITAPGITVLASGISIAPTVISLPEAADGDLERYEGMLVTIATPLTVSQNYFLGRYGQATLAAGGRLVKPTDAFPAGSAEAIALAEANARRRILLDDGSSLQNPNPTPYLGADNTLRAGDTVAGITGVIDYGPATSSNAGISDYKIHPTVPPAFSRDNPRTAAPAAVGGNLRAASFNVLNYFTTFTDGTTATGQSGQGCTLDGATSAANCRGANSAAEFARQRNKIIPAIAALGADVVGLMEIQNNGNTAVQNLVDGLNAVQGAGTWATIGLPAGGTGTDAIRVAMIYRPAKLTPAGGAVSDADPIHNRPPLAQTFSAANGEKFTVVVNHFKSKGSCPASATDANADQGDGQGCWNALRVEQARALRSFVAARQAAAADPDVLLIGDFNAYGKEDPILDLTANGFVDQSERFETQPYSYVFDGESGRLDHALATGSLSAQIAGANHWHINADEPSIIDYNLEFKQPACAACGPDYYTATPFRSSDHDPVVIGLYLPKLIGGTAGRDTLVGTPGDDEITGGVGSDTLTGGAGTDRFVYRSLQEGVDTITDFEPGQDKIVLTQLLATVGIASANPLAGGYVTCRQIGADAMIGIDPDAGGSAAPRNLVLLKSRSCAAAATPENFEF